MEKKVLDRISDNLKHLDKRLDRIKRLNDKINTIITYDSNHRINELYDKLLIKNDNFKNIDSLLNSKKIHVMDLFETHKKPTDKKIENLFKSINKIEQFLNKYNDKI